MKRLLWLLLFLAVDAGALSYDSGNGAVSATSNEVFNDLTSNGNTTIGSGTEDTVTVNASTWTFANDTAVALTGGVNGLNFASNTLSIDATNSRIGINTAAPSSALQVLGSVTFSSMSIVDAYNPSFGAVTSASTSTLTWTEVTDRLNEFVTSSFTVTTAGFYHITVTASASQTAGTGCLLIKNNSTTIAGGTQCTTGATALATALTISMSRVLSLAANDIIRIDGSATSANVTFQQMFLTVERVP